ncbi:hypothetical protein BD289DRAFT_486375 [Coniella lustricola]|uniref:SET domain-containing protein n=1 Tax=Coniella lustricola TaxID=2025994 RepID=A0A2T2ZVF4_9PEZI|nr:hypothetical protein BD289DRAFT_486375 [Coniella lustricola]
MNTSNNRPFFTGAPGPLAVPVSPYPPPGSPSTVIEVRPAGYMGLGVFATQNILKGTRIIDEPPVFTFHSHLCEDDEYGGGISGYASDDSDESMLDEGVSMRNDNDQENFTDQGQEEMDNDEDMNDDDEENDDEEEEDAYKGSPLPATVFRFCDELLLQGLLDGKLSAMEDLSYSQAMYENERIRELIRRFFHERVYPSQPNCSPLSSEELESKVQQFARLYAIRMRCQYSPHTTEHPGSPEGIYALQARINHSCMPNAWHDLNGATGRMTVHAVRDIRAGEQIFVAYGEYLRRTIAERNAELLQMDEIQGCMCAMCLNPYTDELQAQVYRLFWGAFYFLYPDARDVLTETMDVRAAADAAEALRMAQAAVEVLKNPLMDAETKVLADTYRMCCFLCQKLQQPGQAMVYAGLETSLQLIIRGVDNPNFQEADARFRDLQRL